MDISNHKLYLTVKDHSVSKETFNLYRDESIDLVYTYPQPDLDKLPSYYESEDYISHTDGSRSLFEKAYQFVKQIALKNKLKYINHQQLTKGILLDIGAGTGDFLAVAQQDGWQTKGIEPNEKARTIAQTKGVSDNRKYHIDCGCFDRCHHHVACFRITCPHVEKSNQKELKRI